MDFNGSKFIHISKQVFLVTLTTFVIFIGYPLGFIVFVPLIIYRHVVEQLAQIIDPKFGKILKGLDAYLSAHTTYSSPTAVLLPVYYLEKPVDRSELIKTFDENLIKIQDQNGNLMYQRLRQKVVAKFGYHFWHNVDSFDLHHHIKFLDPSCPEQVFRQKDIMKLTCQLGRRPFDDNRSPWEIILIPSFEHEEDTTIKAALIMRFHHCLCDGFSVLKLLERIGVNAWKHSILGVASAKNGAKKNNPLFSLLTFLFFLIEAPYQVLKTFLFSYDDNIWLTRAIKNPFGPIASQVIDQIPIANLKMFKLQENPEKINLTSIILALAVQATAVAMKGENVNGNLSKLHVITPLPLPNHPGDGLCNHWASVKIPINLDLEDVRNTVRNVSREFERVRRSIFPLVSTQIAKLIGSLPIVFIPKLDGLLRSTCIVSSFPGPTHPVDICGSPCKVLFGTGSIIGCAAGTVSFSYNGSITLVTGGYQCNFTQGHGEILAESYRKVIKEFLSLK
ncbi:unnamed protein product [Orchesella dallaii]|uniref:Diacylglycerol O-acyltransferase n=1 Tax=Orchesella dallaii TaxID=48710 RepID=A0ABP1QVM0_9HEXA